jgi:hypothetical protein
MRGGVSLAMRDPSEGGVSLAMRGRVSPEKKEPVMELELARESDEDLWLKAVGRPTPSRYSIFGGSFNIEYWSTELFSVQRGPEKKVFKVVHEEGRTGQIEVSAYDGQHLEPFDRLVLLALMGLWYDQGCDPKGRIAFSYRELFRRLDLKVGGRQHEAVKGALERLRRCFVAQRDSFVVRTKDGGILPVEREENAFTLLQAKRTATIGGGRSAQTLVVCQLAEAVLFGLAGEFLQPRISAEHLKRLKAKMPHAILLHGYFNGRLKPGETRRFAFEELARVLRMRARHRSTLVARLLGPLAKLEEAEVISIAEPRSQRRRAEAVTITLTLEEGEVKRPPLEPRALDLFEPKRLAVDPQIAAAYFTLGVKLERVLERLGVVSEKTLWSLLEEMRLRAWRDTEEAEAFVLELGYEAPKGYVPPKERFKKRPS